MQEDYTVFKIPTFARREAYDFGAAETVSASVQKPANFDFYDELNQIAEELEKCRLRNS